MRWSWFLCGVLFLLISAYMDNARSSLIPALGQFYQYNYEISGRILVCGQLTALFCTALLLPATNRFSLRTIGLFACLVCLSVCVSVLLVHSVAGLTVWGALVGGGISIMGSLSSIYADRSADEKFKTRAMSACHATYGLASFGAPIFASAILLQPEHWRNIYLYLIPLIILLAIFCNFYAPTESAKNSGLEKQEIKLDFSQSLSVIVMIFYVGAEVLTAMWLTTWFVSNGETLQNGSLATAIFFAIMTVTRMLCSLISSDRWIMPVIWFSLISSLLFFVIGRLTGNFWLIPMMGLLGPFFPLFVTSTSKRFPRKGRVILIWMLTAMQGLLAFMNLFTGFLAQTFGMPIAFWLPAFLLTICIVLLLVSKKFEREGLKTSPI